MLLAFFVCSWFFQVPFGIKASNAYAEIFMGDLFFAILIFALSWIVVMLFFFLYQIKNDDD